jgi:hypothetical protein
MHYVCVVFEAFSDNELIYIQLLLNCDLQSGIKKKKKTEIKRLFYFRMYCLDAKTLRVSMML